MGLWCEGLACVGLRVLTGLIGYCGFRLTVFDGFTGLESSQKSRKAIKTPFPLRLENIEHYMECRERTTE